MSERIRRDIPHYRALDPRRIIATAEAIELRIASRFPEAGLRKVAAELVSLARDLSQEAEALHVPIWWLRVLVGAVLAAGALVFIFVGTVLPIDRFSSGEDLFESVQGIEASMNTIILAGIGLLTLVRLEERIKRKRAFRALHTLRSMIHVIDMHQLTKDPAVLSTHFRTSALSPQRITDAFELERYLDYCSEMLSITGKVAALFAQAVDDEVVIDAVNSVEELGSTLSRKIWQKIMMIGEMQARR
jgi:hypothetical protein